MRLLNVRLDDEDARLVRRLRDRGVSISHVVREAIREEAARGPGATALSPAAILAEMRTRFPAPAGEKPSKRVDVPDRRRVAQLIRSKLRSRR